MGYTFFYTFLGLIILYLLLIVFSGIKNVKFNKVKKLETISDCEHRGSGHYRVIKEILFDERYKHELDELIKMDELEGITNKQFKNCRISDFYRVNNLEEMSKKYEKFDNTKAPKNMLDYLYVIICVIYIIGVAIHYGFTSGLFIQLILFSVLILCKLRIFNFWMNDQYVCKSCNSKGLHEYFCITDGIKHDTLTLLRCEKCGKKYCSSSIHKKTE